MSQATFTGMEKWYSLVRHLIIISLLVVMTPASRLLSATNYVYANDDLQSSVNNAGPNDQVYIFPGSFGKVGIPITINKPLTLAAAVTNVTINAPIVITGSGDWYLQQITFSSSVSIQSTGTVSAVGCQFGNPVTSTGVSLRSSSNQFYAPLTVDLTKGSYTNLQAYDTTFYTLTKSGGKALLKRCSVTSYVSDTENQERIYHAIITTNTALELLRITSPWGIASVGTQKVPISLIQSSIGVNGSGYISLNTNTAWIGYNKVSGNILAKECNLQLVGNIICQPTFNNYPTLLFGGTIQAYNNIFGAQNFAALYCLFLADLTDDAVLVNNTFYSINGSAIRADGKYRVYMRGNAIRGDVFSRINQDNSTVNWDIEYCVFKYSDSVPLNRLGCCYGCDEGFVSPSLSTDPSGFFLKTNSVCIAAGPPQPVYNNHGTTNRNNIGFTGGPFYNPANFTNDNPLVYLLTGTPQIFTKGRTNIVSVNAAAVAGN